MLLFIWSDVSVHWLNECQILFGLAFGLHHLLWKMWLFSCSMLRYVHQIFTNCVCLLFGVGQKAHSEFIRAVLLQIYWLRIWGPDGNFLRDAKKHIKSVYFVKY